MLARVMKAFRKLDTDEVCAAIDAAKEQNRGLAVSARALRMDVSCAAPSEAVNRITASLQANAGAVLRNLCSPPEGTHSRGAYHEHNSLARGRAR